MNRTTSEREVNFFNGAYSGRELVRGGGGGQRCEEEAREKEERERESVH